MSQKNYPLLVPFAVSGLEDVTVTAPYDGSIIATMQAADEAVVEQALATAHQLYRNRDAWLSVPQRIAILEKTMTIMREHQESLALQAAQEGGKPLIDSRVEAARAIDGMQICIEQLRTQQGNFIPMRYNTASLNRVAFTTKEPIGVVVAVSAFNHPLNLIVHQVAAGIAAGCPVIVKPATNTPISCWNFVKAFHDAGLPPEWCQALVIKENELASKLVTDERVGFFSFIGSARVGWALRSQLAPGTRCALEHGGVAPVIVAADADLARTVPALTKAGFYHAGQVCVSVQRVFADKKIARQLAEQLAEHAQQLKVGDPTSAETEVGPLINPSEVDRVNQWISEAREGGAELLTGGKKISQYCHECTVLFNPAADATISRNEVFGPAVCVYEYEHMDAAIEQANALPFAFQAAVFTQDIDTAMRAYSRLDASAVMVNEHTAFRVDGMPFAGLRHSGLGVGGIPYTMHDMQIEKMMVLRSEEL